MLFNSATFIFAFLPATVLGYFLLQHGGRTRLAKVWLVLCSLFFYGFWKIDYLPIILVSIVVNYTVGRLLVSDALRDRRRAVLVLGILFDLGLLGYFKYADFFLENLGLVTGAEIEPIGLVLPLAISFFTFQQIAYLVDSYRGLTREHSPLEYALFVSFFPQLIAGPIVHHSEMMPQFADDSARRFDIARFTTGITIFGIGLFKKVVIADTLAVAANAGYAASAELDLLPSWETTLAYTFQLYFDFSGYTDMAIGGALMLNIELPPNFHSPYKATSIQDFWRRWHMTLSRWLRDYVYVPLGGSRISEARTRRNLVLTFLIGGLWHGAGWTFVVWGALHGVGMVVHRMWKRLGMKMPRVAAIAVTFLGVHVTWVFFRATSFEQATNVLAAMVGLNGIGSMPELAWATVDETAASLEALKAPLMIAVAALLSFFAPSSLELVRDCEGELRQPPSFRRALATGLLVTIALNYVVMAESHEFLYFNF